MGRRRWWWSYTQTTFLPTPKDQATMDRFAAEPGQEFKLKDMGDARYYMGCHITRNRKARELKLDQHFYA